MVSAARRRLVLDTNAESDRAISDWIAALEESRDRTLSLITGLDEALLDVDHPMTGNSIGTLLYHLAAIEADWLFFDIQEQDFPEHIGALLPHDVRTRSGRLTPVCDVTLADHIERLVGIRQELCATCADMGDADMRRVRRLPEYDVTPRWVFNHLIQHEAEHRMEMSMIVSSENGIDRT